MWRDPEPWMPSLRCATWRDAHDTAASMFRGGVLLRTPTPPPVGAPVHLTLRLPDGTELVLVGSVLSLDATPGALVRFRVAAPIVAQLESRAWHEQHRAARPARPLARGSLNQEPVHSPGGDEAGTTYSIHRRKKP
jgi:hypothetical protein